MKNLGLVDTERDLVLQMFASDSWTPFVKLMKGLQANYDKKVLKYHLDNGPEGLVIEKARCEGIDSFISELLKIRLTEVRKGDQDESRRRIRRTGKR